MIIHLFGSTTPVGSYFNEILKKRGYKKVFLYSRRDTNVGYNFCDMQKPDKFLETNSEEESIIISFAPIWITSDFLFKIYDNNPKFFCNVKKVIVCSSSSFKTKRFSFNKADQDLYYKLKISHEKIMNICISNNLDFKIVLPTLVYGSHNEFKDKNFRLLIKIMRLSPFLILPKNSGLRQPISCYQLANVFLKLLENDHFFENNIDPLLSVGGDQIISYIKMLELLKLSTNKNDLAKRCALIKVPNIVFLIISFPLIIISFKLFESVLRIFANLSHFTCQSEITNNPARSFPHKISNND